MKGFGVHNLLRSKKDEMELRKKIREMIFKDIDRGLLDNRSKVEEAMKVSKGRNEMVELRLDSGLSLFNAFLLGRGEIIVPNLDDVNYIIENGPKFRNIEMTNAIFSVDKSNKVIGQITFIVGGNDD